MKKNIDEKNKFDIIKMITEEENNKSKKNSKGRKESEAKKW